MIFHLPIKALSANALYRNVPGRGRVKTEAYKQFHRDMMLLLPAGTIWNQQLSIAIMVGLSNVRQDLDNTAKPILDCLQEKYQFNDSRVYSLSLEKVIVPKTKEFIVIRIEKHERGCLFPSLCMKCKEEVAESFGLCADCMI
jgi:Holliday junction resolvase RusA-like endonuclease